MQQCSVADTWQSRREMYQFHVALRCHSRPRQVQCQSQLYIYSHASRSLHTRAIRVAGEIAPLLSISPFAPLRQRLEYGMYNNRDKKIKIGVRREKTELKIHNHNNVQCQADENNHNHPQSDIYIENSSSIGAVNVTQNHKNECEWREEDEKHDEKRELDQLIAMTRSIGSAKGLNVVAYSGGVDSALVAYLVHKAFPNGRAAACIGNIIVAFYIIDG